MNIGRTFGQIGVCTEEIKNCLVWSVHYSNHFAIRAEACRSLRLLREQSPEVVVTLQERFLVENDPSVKRELQKSLMEISGWSPVDEIDEVQKVKHAVRMLSTPHSVKQRVILTDYCQQAQIQPASLDCLSELLSGMDSSKIKADVPSSTSPNTTKPQNEYQEEAAEDEDKMVKKIPLASQENAKKEEPTNPIETKKGKENEQDQRKDDPPKDPSKDPSCPSEKVKSDFLETKTFLTELDPQIFSQGKPKKKEPKADIRNESKFVAQKKKKKQTPIHSTTYKNLVESLPHFAANSAQRSESGQGGMSTEKLAEKSLSEKENLAECFNELLLRYADLFIQAETFSSSSE